MGIIRRSKSKGMNIKPLNRHKSMKCSALALVMLFMILFVPRVCVGNQITFPTFQIAEYYFITDPYATPGETIETVLSGVLNLGDEVWLWTGNNWYVVTYFGPDAFGPGLDWVDSNYNVVSSPICPPSGEGFVYLPASGVPFETLTLAGTPGSGPSTMTYGTGHFNLVGNTGDTAASYDDIVGSPPVSGSQLVQWNATRTGFNYYTYTQIIFQCAYCC
jgi:hypothetical protein